MSANSTNNTDNKEYAKIEANIRPNRSSSLTMLLQQDRSTRSALQPADVPKLDPNVAEANVATGMNLVFGTWKKEDRIPPRPSQAEVEKSGFEMEAAKRIVEKYGGGTVDPEMYGEGMVEEGDEDIEGEENGVAIPRG